ncbi:MAG: hypothetical protein M0Z88_07720 [Actinomycetota bacterium]|nr:hypothetical protein [Actinomycetota bacterium]
MSGILASVADTAPGSGVARDLKDATNGQLTRLGQNRELLLAKEVARELSSARKGNKVLAGHLLPGEAEFVGSDSEPRARLFGAFSVVVQEIWSGASGRVLYFQKATTVRNLAYFAEGTGAKNLEKTCLAHPA